jgi:uncharacterized protein (TIGR03083 family)
MGPVRTVYVGASQPGDRRIARYTARVEVPDHVAALRREGEMLAAAGGRTDLDAHIPTCPEWRMRDLLRHMGDVHRWATAHVAEGRAGPTGAAELHDIAGPLPEDQALLDWFREGHAALVRTLETADPGLVCWSFLPAPSPVAFWARRQAHETGMHRADAESPGGRISAFPPPFALDGIDELLFGFLARPGEEMRMDPPRALHLHATDVGAEWVVRLGPDGVLVDRGQGPADCSVRGSASDLHLLLWNRRVPDELDVQGDASLLSFWRGTVRVQWSRPR